MLTTSGALARTRTVRRDRRRGPPRRSVGGAGAACWQCAATLQRRCLGAACRAGSAEGSALEDAMGTALRPNMAASGRLRNAGSRATQDRLCRRKGACQEQQLNPAHHGVPCSMQVR
jgi:hypothetical protein